MNTTPPYPHRFTNLDAARAQFGDRVDRLGPYLWDVDTLADEVVGVFADLPHGEGFRRFEQALKHGVDSLDDCPAAMRAFFDHVEHVPVFVDWDAVDQGGQLLFRAGPLSGLVLGLKSLVFGYCSPAGNKPLVLSGRLTARAQRRINETARFVYEISMPGGLRRGAPGYRIALKVRVMHAKVRHLIKNSAQWDRQAWGEPINMHDMLATSLLFSVVLMRGLEMLGLELEAEESRHYMDMWRYAGWLSGVPLELLPTSYEDGLRLGELIYRTQGPPDDDSRALVAALLNAGVVNAAGARERVWAERQIPVNMGICRALMGPEISDQLALPETPWRHVVPMLRQVVRNAERVRRVVPGSRELAVRTGRKQWEAVLMADKRPFTFAPPAGLRNAKRT